MPFPDRDQLKDALLRLIADGSGQVEVKPDRVLERLADEFALTPEERDMKYESGAEKWVQDVRMVRDALLKQGYIQRGTKKGIWALTPEGLARGEELLEEYLEDAPSSYAAEEGGNSLPPFLVVGPAEDEEAESEGGLAVLAPEEDSSLPEESPVPVEPSEPDVEPIEESSAAQSASDEPLSSVPSFQEQERQRDAVAEAPEHRGGNATSVAEVDLFVAPAPPAVVSVADEPKQAKNEPEAGEAFLLAGLSEIGFVVEPLDEKTGLARVRSPLPSVAFDADVWFVESSGAVLVRSAASRALLVVTPARSGDSPRLVRGEGTMVVRRDLLESLVRSHLRFPFALDEVVDALRATEQDGGEGQLERMAADRQGTMRAMDLAGILLTHSLVRAEYGEDVTMEPEQVFWFLFGNPALRGIYTRQDVHAALEILASPAIGALRRRGDAYVQVMSPENAARRFRSLGEYLPQVV